MWPPANQADYLCAMDETVSISFLVEALLHRWQIQKFEMASYKRPGHHWLIGTECLIKMSLSLILEQWGPMIGVNTRLRRLLRARIDKTVLQPPMTRCGAVESRYCYC